MEPSNRSTGLLAIAGGGARGVMPGAYLDFIHKEFKVDPKKLFHYHSGTSVGSIVALGLAKKGEQTVSDINKCLLETLPKVFSSPSIFSKIIHLGYAFQEEYGAAPLQAALNAQFGDALYNETTKPVLIMATKTNPVSPYRFISDQKSPYPNLTMTQVLRCSSAAPTYLPGFFLTNEKGGQDEFIDGGMSGANDPTNVAITYFSRRIPLNKKVVVLSLQTGECPLALPKSSSRWGWLTWVGSHNEALITSLFDTMITNT
ncbi:MAG: patatin-like phospholipase family protein, partial [Parachlamydiaceae bacterium]